MEQSASGLDAHIFDNLPDRSPQDQPGDQKADGQDAGPDQERHGQFPARIPEVASDGLIVESERFPPQETDLKNGDCAASERDSGVSEKQRRLDSVRRCHRNRGSNPRCPALTVVVLGSLPGAPGSQVQ